MESIGLVVTTRNRPFDLLRSIPTFAANSDDLTEIVIIDQSTDDRTREIVMGLKPAAKVRYVRCPLVGSSVGRNLGLELVTAPLIGFTDDDCLLPRDWARSVAHVFAAAEVGAYFGAVAAEPFDWRQGFTPSVPNLADRLLTSPDPGQIPGLMGANMAFRREALAGIGGFDPLLGAGAPLRSAEEMDAAYRVLLAGYSVALRSRPTVTHFGFRVHAGGATRDLVRSTHLGMGAYFGKHIRSGDGRAAAAYLNYLRWLGRQIIASSRVHRRPAGMSRVAYSLRGFVAQFAYPVDRRTRLFETRSTTSLARRSSSPRPPVGAHTGSGK
jgi:glycosyltransferase involved in cell wall biosynthesis